MEITKKKKNSLLLISRSLTEGWRVVVALGLVESAFTSASTE